MQILEVDPLLVVVLERRGPSSTRKPPKSDIVQTVRGNSGLQPQRQTSHSVVISLSGVQGEPSAQGREGCVAQHDFYVTDVRYHSSILESFIELSLAANRRPFYRNLRLQSLVKNGLELVLGFFEMLESLSARNRRRNWRHFQNFTKNRFSKISREFFCALHYVTRYYSWNSSALFANSTKYLTKVTIFY